MIDPASLVIEHYQEDEFMGWWTYDAPLPRGHYVDPDAHNDGHAWIIEHAAYTPELWQDLCVRYDGSHDEFIEFRMVRLPKGAHHLPTHTGSDVDRDDPNAFPRLLEWYAAGEATAFDVYAHYVKVQADHARLLAAAAEEVKDTDHPKGEPLIPATWFHVVTALELGVLTWPQFTELRLVFFGEHEPHYPTQFPQH